jgi:hypothetical protein
MIKGRPRAEGEEDIFLRLSKNKSILWIATSLIKIMIISFYAFGLILIFREDGFTFFDVLLAYISGIGFYLIISAIGRKIND